MTQPGYVDVGLCAGELTLNAVSMHMPGAWDVTNTAVLWSKPSRRFGNTTIPGAPGDHPNPVRVAAAKHGMKMLLSGVYTMDGDHWQTAGLSSAYEGLEANLAYLEDSVFDPPALPATTIPGELVMPSLTIRTADVQITNLEAVQAEGAPIMRVAFDLVVPIGAFAA